jgi:hypothetical protein
LGGNKQLKKAQKEIKDEQFAVKRFYVTRTRRATAVR